MAGRVAPDAEAFDGSTRTVIGRYEPAIAPTNAESASVVVAKSAGHAVCRRRRDRTAPALVRDEARRASLAAYCAVVDAAAQEYVMQSASRRRKNLDLAISRCQFDG